MAIRCLPLCFGGRYLLVAVVGAGRLSPSGFGRMEFASHCSGCARRRNPATGRIWKGLRSFGSYYCVCL